VNYPASQEKGREGSLPGKMKSPLKNQGSGPGMIIFLASRDVKTIL